VQLLVGGTTAAHPSGSSDPVLTTEQAARLAGVSRPYMAHLIDTGAVALHKMVGKQRRVLRSAVSDWQQAERTRQAKSLKRLARDLDEEIFST
jgi:excisionase family DNA binding protein